MIRLSIVYLFIFSLVLYSWKDWFKVLCALILLMAVIKDEDMPTNMFGIQGFNLWNILFLSIFIAWLVSRRKENLRWDMPKHINLLLLLYLAVVVIGVLRALIDQSNLGRYGVKDILSEEFINTIKWTLPGILLFDGCRTRKRVILSIWSLLLLYFLLSLQVIYRVPWTCALGSRDDDVIRALNRACREIGYTYVDISTFLAGASWAIIAVIPLFIKKRYKIAVFIAAILVVFAQALTGGRAGYAAWGATGLTLCLLKWRKYLLLTPVVVILLPVIFPGAVERMFTGFGQTDASGQSTTNENAVTSDRNIIWPYLIHKIGESPLIGYGRLGMRRVGLVNLIENEHPGIGASQPHNMYLEALLDNGIIGSIPLVLFWLILVVYSSRLFRNSNRLCSAVGGIGLAFMLAQLFAGIGSQHFYPEESTLGTWAAIFLMLRVYIEQKKNIYNYEFITDLSSDRYQVATASAW